MSFNILLSVKRIWDYVLCKNFTVVILIIPGIQFDKGSYATNSIA